MIDVLFSEQWQDPRLVFPSFETDKTIVLDPAAKNKLWIPDIYFANALQGSVLNVPVPVTFIELRNNTTLIMVFRITTKLNCDMNLFNFPQDTQVC